MFYIEKKAIIVMFAYKYYFLLLQKVMYICAIDSSNKCRIWATKKMQMAVRYLIAAIGSIIFKNTKAINIIRYIISANTLYVMLERRI